jgi:hypothetical protein
VFPKILPRIFATDADSEIGVSKGARASVFFSELVNAHLSAADLFGH